MPRVDPNSNQNQEQENIGTEPDDLGQSQYDFRYKIFPNDLGMDDNGHYMIININVPTEINSPNTPSGRYTNQFRVLDGVPSKVDTLRFGRTGTLNGAPGGEFFGGVAGGSASRSFFSIQRRTRRISESIALHMPTPLVYNTHNAYEEISLSALAGRLGTSILAGVFAAGGAAFGRLQGAINAAAAARGLSTAAGNVIGVASKLLQSPINPAVEILFANTLVRQFTLEVLMAPRNEEESINMHAIIKTLRFHSAPELSVGSVINLPLVGNVDTSGFFWIPPAEFDITFFNKGRENMNILRINTCVMERIEVDYAPTGVYSTFRNGHPVAARLSMGFRELEPVHKRRVLQGF
jgi:hypothetical protein